MRLDKFLSEMGAGTRSELKKDIKKGHVSVDGSVVTDPSFKVSAESDVTYRGKAIGYEQFVYYMLSKPAGIISASEDPREETVIDLITEQKRKDLFPVGRLDRDTEGLLLITNDGELAHRLLSPKHHVDKTYYAVISGEVTPADTEAFRRGLMLPDGLDCMPADLRILTVRSEAADPFSDQYDHIISEILITIREGKFHQIKRMFSSVGKEVTYLKRLSMGPLELDPELTPGEYRKLTDTEIKSLKEL